MSAAINSDEDETNKRIERLVHERQEFGQWWREWADTRACYTTFVREVAFEAWKQARRTK